MARSLVVLVLGADLAMVLAGSWLLRRAAAEPLVVTLPHASAAPAAEVATPPPPAHPPVAERERERDRRRAEPVAVVTEPDAAPPPAPAAIVPDAAPVVVVPDAAPAAPPSPPPEPAEDIENVVADAVRKQIEAHRESVEQCYQRAAKSSTPEDPLAGRVEIHMTVQPAGDVTNVRVVRNDTGSDALGSCLVGVLSGFTIAGPPHEAIDYVWPFLFSGAEPK